MWAQVLVEPGKLEYKRIPIPQYGSKEVLVEITTACICNGSDPLIYDGFEDAYPTPLVFGHEPFGKIVACGDEVEDFQPGDRVSWWFSLGAFAEYVAVNPSLVAMAKVPDSISTEEAPIFELMAASRRAVKAAGIKPGCSVLILGLGPSGLIMSQDARLQGASTVVGWDLYEYRRTKGLSLGCTAAFNPLEKNALKETAKLAEAFDVIIDAMGDDISEDESTFNQALKLLKKGGRVVTYGHPAHGRRFSPFLFQNRSAVLVSPPSDMNVVRPLLRDGIDRVVRNELKLRPLISAHIGLDEVERGLQLVRTRPDKYLKIIVHVR